MRTVNTLFRGETFFNKLEWITAMRCKNMYRRLCRHTHTHTLPLFLPHPRSHTPVSSAESHWAFPALLFFFFFHLSFWSMSVFNPLPRYCAHTQMFKHALPPHPKKKAQTESCMSLLGLSITDRQTHDPKPYFWQTPAVTSGQFTSIPVLAFSHCYLNCCL